jgi:muconolactone delta-isomerase
MPVPMEFLVEFTVEIPSGAANSEILEREDAEAVAAARLVEEGHLVRLWRRSNANTILGLYRADSDEELDGLLAALPLAG